MTNDQLIAKFNPNNAANLTASDLETMRNLTDDQIGVLAQAYPNTPTRKPYLRLYDTKLADNKQLFQLSTWQNLRNVRKFSNMKNLKPYDFILPGNKLQTVKANVKTTVGKNTVSPRKVVVDLTAKEAADLLKEDLNGGDKKQTGAKAEKKPSAAKPTTGKAPAGKKTELKAVPASVENNESQPDNEFTDGQEQK
jgi:hypothetical protein